MKDFSIGRNSQKVRESTGVTNCAAKLMQAKPKPRGYSVLWESMIVAYQRLMFRRGSLVFVWVHEGLHKARFAGWRFGSIRLCRSCFFLSVLLVRVVGLMPRTRFCRYFPGLLICFAILLKLFFLEWEG